MKTGTVIAIVVGVGAVGAVGYYAWQRRNGAVQAQQIATQQEAVKQQVAANPYENKLVQIGPDVYLVLSGVERYVGKLPLVNGRSWGEVIKVGNHVAPIGSPLNLQTLKGFLIR